MSHKVSSRSKEVKNDETENFINLIQYGGGKKAPNQFFSCTISERKS